MTRNESGIASIIHDHLRERAEVDGLQFSPFPLGGQDRSFLSDSLLGRLDHFCLVEMKFGQAQLKSEATKRARVEALCRALENCPDMRSLHDRCHFIAWKDSASRVVTSPYRDRICNQEVLGTACRLTSESPNRASTVKLNSFADGFLGLPPTMCLPKVEFKQYLEWLHGIVTGEPVVRIELLGRSIDEEGEVVAMQLTSIDEVHEWFTRRPALPAVRGR